MRYCVVHTRELHQPQQMVSRRSAHTGMPSLALARAEERYTSSSLDVAVLVMQASGVRRSRWTMCSVASVLRCEERAHCTARLRPEGGSVLVAQAHAALEAIRPLDEGHACAKATPLVTCSERVCEMVQARHTVAKGFGQLQRGHIIAEMKPIQVVVVNRDAVKAGDEQPTERIEQTVRTLAPRPRTRCAGGKLATGR